MKKYLIIGLLVNILLLVSCTKGERMLEKVEQDSILYTQLIKTSDYNTVNDKLRKSENVYNILKELGIYQYKSIDYINYTAIKCSDGFYLLLFDVDGKYGTLEKIVFSSAEEKSFYALHTGMTLEDVKKIDSNGTYDFVYHSWSDYPQLSYHFFESGECFMINYDEHIIKEIVHFTI